MNPLTIKEKVQLLSKKFYDTKNERDFTALCNLIQPTVYNISMHVLKDHDVAMINVNDVFMKIYNNMMGILTDKNSKPFVYLDTPFFSYVNSIAHNKAKMKYNKHKNSGIKYVFEASSEEDESNMLVDVLPTSSKEYFDLNNEEYTRTFGDAEEVKTSKCVVKIVGTTISIVPDDAVNEPIPNKVIYKIKERYKKYISQLPEYVMVQPDMISFDISDWIIILQNDCMIDTFNSEEISHKVVTKMIKDWVESAWMEKAYVSGPKKFVCDEQQSTDLEIGSFVHNSDKIKYGVVKNIINSFNSNSILMDAMVNLKSYNAVAEKHDIGSFKQYESLDKPGTLLTEEEVAAGASHKIVQKNRSSAIKTRVFRSKKIINKIMGAEILYSEIINEGRIYTGHIKLYYNNGKPKMCGYFDKSRRQGKFTFYFDNGCVKKIIQYTHNVCDGEYKEYSKSGSILVDGIYKDGLKNGTWKYYKAKTIVTKLVFHFGVPGFYERYSNTGNIIEGKIYTDGCNIGEVVA